jgi:aminoglycoside phosphotransferase (APT) family kinase protein
MSMSPSTEAIDAGSAVRGLGFNLSGPPQPVTGGWDARIWRFETWDGASYALRVHVLPDREEMARRERAALRACEAAAFPAPRLIERCRIQGLPVTVISWCPGRPLAAAIARKPWQLPRLSRLFGRTHALMHRIPPPAGLLESGLDWVRRLPGQYQNLAQEVLLMQPATTSLVHLDYHPFNVILHDGAISGVVDWSGAAAGDVRADLARTHAAVESAPLPPGPLRPLLGRMRGLFLKGWRLGYEDIAGRMPDYSPFLAWAAACLLGEVRQVVGQQGVWGDERYLEQLAELIERYQRAAAQRPGWTTVDASDARRRYAGADAGGPGGERAPRKPGAAQGVPGSRPRPSRARRG